MLRRRPSTLAPEFARVHVALTATNRRFPARQLQQQEQQAATNAATIAAGPPVTCALPRVPHLMRQKPS